MRVQAGDVMCAKHAGDARFEQAATRRAELGGDDVERVAGRGEMNWRGELDDGVAIDRERVRRHASHARVGGEVWRIGREASVRSADREAPRAWRPRERAEFGGAIESLGWAVYQTDTGVQNLLPAVAPTVDWVRLTQRYPVRIRLDEEARKLPLKIGVTASVRVVGPPVSP